MPWHQPKQLKTMEMREDLIDIYNKGYIYQTSTTRFFMRSQFIREVMLVPSKIRKFLEIQKYFSFALAVVVISFAIFGIS